MSSDSCIINFCQNQVNINPQIHRKFSIGSLSLSLEVGEIFKLKEKELINSEFEIIKEISKL